jgi:hypothetical protein
MNRRVCMISLVREERADRSAIADASARSVRGVFMGGVFVDPGKYEFYSCEQIAANRKDVEARVQKLELLMDKAEKGAGGRWSV